MKKNLLSVPEIKFQLQTPKMKSHIEKLNEYTERVWLNIRFLYPGHSIQTTGLSADLSSTFFVFCSILFLLSSSPHSL